MELTIFANFRSSVLKHGGPREADTGYNSCTVYLGPNCYAQYAVQLGLGIHSIVFSSESLLFVCERAKECFAHSCRSSVMSDLSKSLMVDLSELLPWLFKNQLFESDSLEIWANHWHCSVLKKSRAILSWTLFCKERWERLALGCSFLKSEERELLTVAL